MIVANRYTMKLFLLENVAQNRRVVLAGTTPEAVLVRMNGQGGSDWVVVSMVKLHGVLDV